MIGLTPATAGVTSALSAGADRAANRAASSFDQALEAATERREKLHDAADQLVATAFILPLLAQVRDDPFKGEMFHGGQAEQVFGQQLDVILADRITESSRFGISDAMVRRFEPGAPASEVDLRG
jgi:Rod binding domain-containing protein